LYQANERFVILDARTGQILSRGFLRSDRTNCFAMQAGDYGRFSGEAA